MHINNDYTAIKDRNNIINEINLDNAKEQFRKCVTNIDIAISSRCYNAGGKKCVFCPNVSKHRQDAMEDHFMDMEIYKKFIGELASISYLGSLAFNRYNDPLHVEDMNLVAEYLKFARDNLPNCKIHLQTDGSYEKYVNRKNLDLLYKNGLNSLFIQIYPGENDLDSTRENIYVDIEEFGRNYSTNFARSKAQEIANRLELNIKESIQIDNVFNEYFLDYPQQQGYPQADFRIYEKNLMEFGCNRAGTVNLKGKILEERETSCFVPLGFIAIDWNGNVYPCCNMPDGLEELKNFCMGNIEKEEIYQIYASEKNNEFRKKVCNIGVKDNDTPDPCKKCNFVPHALWLKNKISEVNSRGIQIQ